MSYQVASRSSAGSHSKEMSVILKRALDFIVAGSLLILLIPVLLAVGLMVGLKLGRPVIFRQFRSGRNGKEFTVYKFRTMTNQRDERGNLLPSDRRMTTFGRALRSTSLDELPQLWNVVRGDMSLVGPRPLLVEYDSLYSERQKKRLLVLPGITGWAQVRGRNQTSWEERLENDAWYVENWSLALDAKILLMTFSRVVKRSGVESSETVTMPRFEGTKDG